MKTYEKEGAQAAGLSCNPWPVVLNSYGCKSNAECLLTITVTSQVVHNPSLSLFLLSTLLTYICIQNGMVVSENLVPLQIPGKLSLPKPDITFTVSEAKDGGADVTLATDKVALYVTLTTQASGRFSENSILMLPGKKVIHFFPFGPFSLAAFSSTLRVEHTQQYQ